MDATIEYGTPGWYLLRRMSWGGRRAGRRREKGGSEAAILPDAAYLPLNRIGDAGGDAPGGQRAVDPSTVRRVAPALGADRAVPAEPTNIR